MTRFSSMSETLDPANANAYRSPVSSETASAAAPDGPALKNGFEFVQAIKRTFTGQAVSSKQLLIVTSQLAVMLAAGCDLCAGLEAMAKQQAHPQLKKIMAD